jgi:solute carrier family 35 (UDP-galactose transporter), member B1
VRSYIFVILAPNYLTWSPVSVPFQSLDGASAHKFQSALFIGTCQSALSSVSALLYILICRSSSDSLAKSLGLTRDEPSSSKKSISNGTPNGKPISHQTFFDASVLLRYFQCSMFITSAAPFGFAALSYISYPAMVLGKSCKLVPVMFMNVLLYRRKFAPYKYLVVAMVTLGITIFMGFGNDSGKKKMGQSGKLSPYANLVGITYLLINLALDGATNSTQDEIFSKHKVTGQQMMFWINLFCTGLSLTLSILPLPYIPVIHPSSGGSSELMAALTYIREHKGVAREIGMFALTGSLGQLFIFETLQHFGSLTLVYVPYPFLGLNSDIR